MNLQICVFRAGRRVAVALAVLALSQPVLAGDAPPPGSSLAAALEQAWRLHPQASALDSRDAEARAVREVADGLTPEPGALSIGGRSDRYQRNAGRQEYEVEVATPLWLPGQKSARQAEAASRIDEAAAKRSALRLELAGELREAWWTLAAARNARALAERRLTTARALHADVRRRHEVGELSRIDANLAQMEAQTAQSEVLEADAALLQAEQSFRELTGAPAPQTMGEEMPAARRSGEVTPEATPESSQSSAQHPQLAAAAAAARTARARVKVADESRRAAPELALRVVRERDDFAEPFANSVGVRLKIPFSSGAQVRRENSAAQAESDQADAEMQRLQRRVELDALRAERTLQAAERQFAVAGERRALSADNLRLAEKSFALGESDIATLLRIRAAAYDAEAFLDRQSVARAVAIARLNQALGVLP